MEEQNIELQNEKSISINDILILFKKFWLQVVCIILACTVLAGVASIFLAKPKYKASATIMVSYVSNSGSSVSVDQAALNLSLSLVDTVADFIGKNVVAEDVAKIAKEKKANGEECYIETGYRSGLSIKTENRSLILTVTYTTKSGQKQAVETVNQIVKSLKNVADSYGENGRANFPTLRNTISIVDLSPERGTVSQTWPMFVLLGFAGGIVLAIVFIVLKYMLDDTVKSKAELESITGFKAIAFIEDIEISR